jgi:hypothetical protein
MAVALLAFAAAAGLGQHTPEPRLVNLNVIAAIAMGKLWTT